jgi:type IV pilus assembly protein PilB
MNLIQQLVKEGLIDKKQTSALEFEVKTSGKKPEEIILEKGLLSESSLFSLKSEILKTPLKEVVPEKIPLEILELIPEESARFYWMAPLEKKDNVLGVGMVYPEDIKAQEALKFLSRQGNFEYEIFLITPSTFNSLLKQYRTLRREVRRALAELESELKTEKVEVLRRPPTATELERLAEEAPITKVVAVILRHAVEGKASDIHIEPALDKLRVRFRMLGVLHPSIFLPMKTHSAIVARVKIISNLKIDETRIPQDGRFSTTINDKKIDFRVSTFPTSLGEKVAIRVLDPSIGLKTFDALGLEGKSFKLIKEASQRPYGLILSTGPTGCGKTTTLYAILQLLNQEGVNIVTLEDPVEYFIAGINQSQVRPEIGYSFSTGLRHVLRQDPDIIMVGEIRDQETALLVTHAALTGHIVLSTLHTANAASVIPRLIDLGVEPFLISPSLSVALAQRLVRKLCPNCKKKIKPKKEVRDMILKEVENLPPSVKKDVDISSSFSVYQAKGCPKCNQTGYSERVGLFEAFLMTDQLAEIISEDPSEVKILAEAKRQEMVTMKQDGILKVLKGITTIEEVLRVAEEN